MNTVSGTRGKYKKRSYMAVTGSAVKDTTLRVGPLTNLPELVRSLGLDPQPLFRQCGMQLAVFADPDNRLPFIATSRLIEHCAEATGADHLGLLLGQMGTASHLGLPGFVLRTAPTARDALDALVNHLDLHDQGGIASLRLGANHSTLSYSLLLAGTCAVEQIYDLSAVMMYNILKSVCGRHWQPDNIYLARRQPRDLGPYQQCFNTQVYFNAPESAITFRSRWLDAVPEGHDQLLHEHLEDEARMLHESNKRDLIEQLPACLHRGLLSGQFSSHQVAASLGMHERTLHRRLNAAGTSFRHELDRARQTLSEELLAGTNLNVCGIATTLGYSDSSGFIRAFQRWSNISPSAWRREHQRDTGAEHTVTATSSTN
jgi:AraC-like DNA-binding protein